MKEWFFLLAGGYGKRARPLTLKTPKPALPLGGVPIINLMLEQLSGRGLDRGFVNTHHLAGQIEACVNNHHRKISVSDIRLLHETTLSGSVIIQEAARFMAEEDLLLVVNGDIFLEIPYASMRRELLSNNADGVLLARLKSTMEDKGYRSLIVDGDRFIDRAPLEPEHISENISENISGYMYLGVVLMRRAMVERIRHINFFESLAEHDFLIQVCPYGGIWLDIGTAGAYETAKRSYLDYLNRYLNRS